MEEIKLNSREKEGLKNKLAKGDKGAIEDPATKLLGAVSTISKVESFFLFSSL